MRTKMVLGITVLLSLALGGLAQADSLEGVWKLETGRWPAGEGDMVYPAGDGTDEGASAFRVFTGHHHVFISSFPAEDIFNATMAKYSVDGDRLLMEKVVARNPGHLSNWEWTFVLDGDRLTVESNGMKETWVRVE